MTLLHPLGMYCRPVLRVAGQARILTDSNGGMLFQIGGDGFGVAAVAFHAQGQGFEALIDVERALRALAVNTSRTSCNARLDDVSGRPGVGNTEAVVKIGSKWELAGGPVKLPLSR